MTHGTGFRPRIPGAAPVFSPADVTNLFLWYDADDAATITQTAGKVSQWADKSPNGYHATQATGLRQPVTASRTLNARNALDFDGTSHLLAIASGAYGLTAGDCTLYVVFYPDILKDQRILSGTSTAYIWGNNAAFSVCNSTAGTSVAAGTIAATTCYAGGYKKTGTVLAPFLAGVAAVAGTGNNVTLTALNLGALSSGNRHFNGLIGEVLFYNRALSTAEQNQIGQYLSAKWGCAWAGL